MFGGLCLQCECNDHAAECDINGVCLGCSHNTTGPLCDSCRPGYYGDPTLGTSEDCQLCACPLPPPNSFSPTCVLEDSGSVSCDRCEEGYAGSRCEKCANGFYGNPLVAGGVCKRCDCHGNVNVSEAGHCDATSGECLRCLRHTGGAHCDTCLPGYHGDAVHAKNCRECGCDRSGAVTGVCDVTTAQCDCRPNVTGLTCDRCQVGFYGIQSGRGCSPCLCSQSGSVSESCDEQGRCLCLEGMGGEKCDRCRHGYYNHTDSGCTACDCARTHGNCHPATGVCICPPHTEGEECERCETGYWGHDPVRGCQACDCTAKGCSALQCDLTNGRCPCQMGFSGRSCDECSPGHHGYPECQACGCDVAGTREDLCNQTLGVCDCRDTGTCVCKASVGGRGCNECVSGTFGLMSENPAGCSPCFCSGVSSVCEERGGLLRVPVHTHTHTHARTHARTADKLAGPLYWRLPRQFEGNKLLSYGGLLSYEVVFYADNGVGLANQEPQILMRGGALKKLVIYRDMVAPSNGIRTRHDIPMTEVKHPDFYPHQRKTLLAAPCLACSCSQHSHSCDPDTGDCLNCQHHTTGTSCDQCAAGYYGVVTGAITDCSPCACPLKDNSFSPTCVSEEMGDFRCTACEQGYQGRYCERCSVGYHGNPWSAGGRCEACGCSEWGSLHAVCDDVTGRCSCRPGVRGRLCDQCADRHVLEEQQCVCEYTLTTLTGTHCTHTNYTHRYTLYTP
uniref:Laminin subunit alpha 1 n=1 Tax=Gadus morhua TaxID=8049 RepID=A0A8C5CA55_GADMO